MSTLVIMNVERNGVRINNDRLQPLVTWLHFFNVVTIAILCLFFLKTYKGLLLLYEWLFPFRHKIQNPVILIMGPKTNLVGEIVLQLSKKFNSEIIDFQDVNDNTREISSSANKPKKNQSRVIFSHVPVNSQKDVTDLSAQVQKTFGWIDILLIAQNEEDIEDCCTDSFLKQLNKQLLTQFWTVMAFLPGMLRRNNGHIISIALGRKSSLANTGIMRTVHEELLQSNTKVRMTLVERNNILEEYLPSLSNDILARLIIRSMWNQTSIVKVPSIPSYALMLPLVMIRLLMKPIIKLVNLTSTRSL